MPRPAHRRARRARRRRGALVVGLAVVMAVTVAAVAVSLSRSPSRAARHAAPSPAGLSVGRQAAGPGPVAPTAAAAATYVSADGVGAAWVVAENRRPGTSAWQITRAQSPTGMMGYADHVDAVMGDTVTLRVSTTAASFHVDAYRMGYYHGLGGRLVWTSSDVPGVVQPPCRATTTTKMVQCQWAASLSFTVTSQWVQGEYLLELVGNGGAESYVPLTVWDPTSHAAYVIMDGVFTDEVFNAFGGYDFYQGATPCAPNVYPCSSRSRLVSFDRPYANDGEHGAGGYLALTYPLTRFTEEEGLDVTYWTDLTLAEHGSLLPHHRLLISPGHDEEWSLSMRTNTVAAAKAGVNVAFMGASAILRKIRLESSPLGADRQVVNYRDPAADPLYRVDSPLVSQNDWAQAPADLPANTLVGATYVGYDQTSAKPLVVSDPSSWLFAGTGLDAGATISGVLAGDMQAFDPRAANNPPGVEILAHSRVDIVGHADRRYADTTYYTMASSHAGIFDSGTVGWIPSLMDCPSSAATCPAPMMRALTANLFRVMGAGPAGTDHPSVANTGRFYR